MATIANLTVKSDDSFEGNLATLTVSAPIAIIPNNRKTKDSEPDYRIVSRKNGFELGAGWKRFSQNTGAEYVSLSLSAPEFGTIYGNIANAPGDDPSKKVIIWNPPVRRQNIRHNSRRRLVECGPRLGVDIRRRVCGVASADIRWSVA